MESFISDVKGDKMEIHKEKLRELEMAKEKLNALESWGVDIWDGYTLAMEDIWEKKKLKQRRTHLVADIRVVFGDLSYQPVSFKKELFDEIMVVLEKHGVIFNG